jgi:hypothetical protein
MNVTSLIAYDIFAFTCAAVLAHYVVIPAIDRFKKSW